MSDPGPVVHHDDETIPSCSKRSPIHNLNMKMTAKNSLSTKGPWFPPTARPRPFYPSSIVKKIGPPAQPKEPPPAWMLEAAASASVQCDSLPSLLDLPPPPPAPTPVIGNNFLSLPPPPPPPPRYGPASRGGYDSKRLVSGGALPGPIGPKPPTSPPTAKVYKQRVDELNAKHEAESTQQRKSMFQLALKLSRTED